MEGSSESAWHRSDSFPGLNTSTVSNRNPRPPSHDSGNRKEIDRVALAPQNLRNRIGLSGACENEVTAEPFVQSIEWGDASLRQWLDKVERPVDEFECLHIFRQVVEIVNVAHSQGIVVHNVRPSCFVMSSFNHVSFIESASCSDSGSDSLEDGLNSQTQEMRNPLASSPLDMCHRRCHLGNEDSQVVSTPANALLEASCMQSSSICATHVRIGEEIGENKILDMNMEQEERKHTFPMKQILLMENSWYRSPEEVAGSQSSCASDIYQLGVLLFELFCPFSSIEDKSRTMSSLRHRVLPPQLLLKWPKEASFCMWLLHPEPIGRPSMGELLQSEFLNEPRDNLGEREAAIQLGEKIEEEELLLEFLLRIRQRKRESADKLQDTVSLLCSDIEEVLKRHPVPKKKGGIDPEKGKDDHLANNFPSLNIVDEGDSSGMGSRKRFCLGLQMENIEGCDDNLDDDRESDMVPDARQSRLFKSFHLMKNFKKLESAYFLTRCRPVRSPRKSHIEHSQVTSEGRSSIVATERSSINSITPKKQNIENEQSGWISPFLEGLCKYLSFSKIKVKADLKQGDLLNSSNLVCSLSFDRDAEFFATAGVNKKIKVFECDTIINEERDIHYPVVEMACRSKLSSICWNSYIKSQIASSNFEGVVQVWDVTQSRVLTEMREHERRVWSIDFSSVDPTMLASGSDDGSVKLWSINQGLSIGTIKTKANVCCVQFPSDSSRSLTFGSADHKIYHYDLRNLKVPLCTLTGHNKTVSYVKSVDSVNLVSASTDNTLKLWDLSVCTSLQSFTGHTNVKNFVGLSVSDGYIATGSETNEVFIYHKAFPMPALSFRFGNTDPLSGHETDDTAQFISSVCWRGQSSTLVAANSTGNIKILEMV